MSVDVCRSPAAGFESILAPPTAALSATSSRTWMQASPAAENEHEHEEQDLISKTQEEEEFVDNDNQETERPPGEFDIWSSIQAQKAKQEAQRQDEPYVHPLVRRSSSLLSQKSLEICTESLGSETGSDEFFSSDEETDFFSLGAKKEQAVQQEQEEEADEVEEESESGHVAARRANGRKELATVNYHCSISRRSSKPRSFPPPLPSISRRDGPCLQMRPHRRDGRLVVEAVAVPSQNYLHAERQNGRLVLSFINTTSSTSYNAPDTETETAYQTQVDELKEEEAQMQAEELEDEEAMMMEVEEEEEEEVEVVDRGTVVEVKVSTNPQQNGSGAAAVKVHRSSIVINKFVGMPAVDNQITNDNHHEIFTAPTAAAAPPLSPVRRLSPTTTTAAAAAVAASSLSAFPAVDGSHSSATDNKLLFTSRRRNREELLHDMRRCSQLKKPLFIWEPCCIATSS